MPKTMRADELIIGDVIDTRCGIPGYSTVTAVHYVERPTGLADQVEVTFAGDYGMTNTRVYRAHSNVKVWEGDPAVVGC